MRASEIPATRTGKDTGRVEVAFGGRKSSTGAGVANGSTTSSEIVGCVSFCVTNVSNDGTTGVGNGVGAAVGKVLVDVTGLAVAWVVVPVPDPSVRADAVMYELVLQLFFPATAK